MKKLYKSKTDKKFSGVCGGLATYFNIDATLIRIVWAILTTFTVGAPGLVIYIICAFVIPEEPDAFDVDGQYVYDTENNNNQ